MRVTQGNVRWGLVGSANCAEVDPVHAQAVVLADALEAEVLEMLRISLLVDLVAAS